MGVSISRSLVYKLRTSDALLEVSTTESDMRGDVTGTMHVSPESRAAVQSLVAAQDEPPIVEVHMDFHVMHIPAWLTYNAREHVLTWVKVPTYKVIVTPK